MNHIVKLRVSPRQLYGRGGGGGLKVCDGKPNKTKINKKCIHVWYYHNKGLVGLYGHEKFNSLEILEILDSGFKKMEHEEASRFCFQLGAIKNIENVKS